MAETSCYSKESSSLLSEYIFSSNFQATFFEHWQKFQDFQNSNIKIISKPFRICKMSNFLRNEKFLKKLRNALLNISYKRNVSDLYQFKQTDDLRKTDQKYIKMLYKTFLKELMPWMQQNTSITLDKKISMSSSAYSDTDFLLCHDDNMGDRRIAFVLYLTEEWSIYDGGALQLFDTDTNNLPRNVVKSLVPEYNSLVFFEVVDNSYHQVAEIISPEKTRLSINGWFHGHMRIWRKPPRPVLTTNLIEPKEMGISLDLWIKDNFLSLDTAKQIQENMEQESFIFLQNFLKHKMYNMILVELKSEDIRWKMVGPADERRYEVADERTLSKILKNFCNMFKSITFCQLLKDYTDIDLVAMDNTMQPRMTIELQRWSAGCYTLITDRLNKDGLNMDSSIDDDRMETSTIESSSAEISDCDQMSTSRSEHETSNSENEKSKLTNADKKRKLSSKLDEPSSSKSVERQNKKRYRQDNSPEGDSNSSNTPLINYDSSEENSQLQNSVLDLIMQFNINNTINQDDTIDYVDADETNGELIHIPAKENHLCLVYRTLDVFRLHHYINHYCNGYFYNLICTYHE